MLRLKDVEMEYESGVRAIRGISLEIADGEFVFLVGPSGSGKSTIVKLLTGEIEPCAGRIMINGFSAGNISERQIPLMRRTLGVVFQDFRLIEKKTVYDNLAFVMRSVGAKSREIRKRVDELLNLVGLEEKARSYPSELSGGEQQRVAIARALLNKPDTIIADEPTGNLDPERSLDLMKLLIQINEMGTTVLVVTHEKHLVDQFQKRVVTIKAGRVVSDSADYEQYAGLFAPEEELIAGPVDLERFESVDEYDKREVYTGNESIGIDQSKLDEPASSVEDVGKAKEKESTEPAELKPIETKAAEISGKSSKSSKIFRLPRFFKRVSQNEQVRQEKSDEDHKSIVGPVNNFDHPDKSSEFGGSSELDKRDAIDTVVLDDTGKTAETEEGGQIYGGT